MVMDSGDSSASLLYIRHGSRVEYLNLLYPLYVESVSVAVKDFVITVKRLLTICRYVCASQELSSWRM